jgi:hypothetical protein
MNKVANTASRANIRMNGMQGYSKLYVRSMSTQPMLPSVAFLVQLHSISPEIVSSIPATGPKGLLKGDVLAFLAAQSFSIEERVYSTGIDINRAIGALKLSPAELIQKAVTSAKCI